MVHRLVHGCAELLLDCDLKRFRKMIKEKRFCAVTTYQSADEAGGRMKSLQRGVKDIASKIRRLTMGQLYYDIDLVNAAPTFHNNLACNYGVRREP
jgi:hypothetical protein